MSHDRSIYQPNRSPNSFREFVEKVKGRTNIVDVIGQHVPLDRSNKGICPFHADNHPSFSVKPEDQIFRCFGCGASGDVISFLQRINDVSFGEALKDLARRAGIPFPRENNDDCLRFEEARKIQDLLTETANYYHQNLTPETRDYFNRERGFTEETITRFILGYSNGGLEHYLVEERGFPLDLCLRAGVLCFNNGETRDFFRSRAIFPNIRHGRVVYMLGRSLDGGEPKYLNLPGGIEYLFNEDALSKREVIVTEGPGDCISASQSGFPTVALLGTSLKPEFLARFSRCEKVYLCLDGDSAGRRAVRELGSGLREKARVVELPEGTDLNDYLKEHPRAEFDALLREAKDYINYELSLIPEDTPKTELPERLDFVMRILAEMSKPKAEAFLGCTIKERFRLSSKDVEAYRAVLVDLRNSDGRTASSLARLDSEAEYKACFEGLVDIVEHQGKPAFLVKEGDEVRIVSEVERGSSTYIPPPREQIPWLLPRGDEVIRHILQAQSVNPQGSTHPFLWICENTIDAFLSFLRKPSTT